MRIVKDFFIRLRAPACRAGRENHGCKTVDECVNKIATADVASDNLLADNPDEYGEIVEENFAIF